MERRYTFCQRFKKTAIELVAGLTLTTTLLSPELVHAQEDITLSTPESSPLDKYLAYLEPQKAAYRQVILDNSPFQTFFPYSINHPYAVDQQLADLDMYLPIFYAAQLEYGVPWDLLWVMDIQETQVSRLYPGASGIYVGAMQRSKSLYPVSQTIEASQNWEILSGLPQRYNSGVSPYYNDYREILWAAQHLTQRAQERYPDLAFLDGILRVVRTGYSAEVFGNQRANRFLAVHPLFEAARTTIPDNLLAFSP